MRQKTSPGKPCFEVGRKSCLPAGRLMKGENARVASQPTSLGPRQLVKGVQFQRAERNFFAKAWREKLDAERRTKLFSVCSSWLALPSFLSFDDAEKITSAEQSLAVNGYPRIRRPSMLRNSFFVLLALPCPARLFVHSCSRAWLQKARKPALSLLDGGGATRQWKEGPVSSSSTSWHPPDPRPRQKSFNITREKKNASKAQAFRQLCVSGIIL